MKINTSDLSKNLFSGFVVSLVALPLGLGLAAASGVPPIAGIITAVVGGIIVAIIGGSHITIAGPGNALIAVTLTAVITLGEGNMLAGYFYTLAAVVCSGVLVFLLGLFRFGALANFFPTTAVQGMLAAIGIIILAGQLHVMLGEHSPEGNNTVELLASVPSSIIEIISGNVDFLPYIIGLMSLLVMILYSRIRNKIFHLIPAPMWIVLIGAGVSYLSVKYPSILKPLDKDYLINIPDDILGIRSFPNFGKFAHIDFWTATLSLTLIASIESLLSIKAVDKLDIKNRRSNANKDLRALGIATVVSGFLGGLNVVIVIARSSVNANNRANNQSSNFFHGLFLLLMIVLFTPAIKLIPMPALAAILVYTGYKLAAPSVFIKTAKVGWEQLLIFLVTMFTTIFTNLIIGIGAGILITILLQLRAISRVHLFTRFLLKPNTLLYQEKDNQYLLSVKAFSNFVNFIGIKNKLDTIPTNAKVIVDFSLTKYIDHTVLEQLEDYKHSFENGGGELEIIGTDDMGTYTSHPLAPRLTTISSNKSRSKLSKRQKAIRLFAKKMEWEFNPESSTGFQDFKSFHYFSTHQLDSKRNSLKGSVKGVTVNLADVDYHEGEFILRENIHSTMVVLSLPYSIPMFVLDKENLLDKVANLAGFNDINFKRYPEFSRVFRLKGKEESEIRNFFSGALIDFLQENKAYHIESNGSSLLIFEKERLSSLSEIKQLVSFASRLARVLSV